jgi:hypothetical protein
VVKCSDNVQGVEDDDGEDVNSEDVGSSEGD